VFVLVRPLRESVSVGSIALLFRQQPVPGPPHFGASLLAVSRADTLACYMLMHRMHASRPKLCPLIYKRSEVHSHTVDLTLASSCLTLYMQNRPEIHRDWTAAEVLKSFYAAEMGLLHAE
jgi:hypothetical protein